MFCTRCGKKIDYESNLCVECTVAVAEEAKRKKEEETARASEEFFSGRSSNAYDGNFQTAYGSYTEAPNGYAPDQQMPVGNTKKAGFGRALAGTIISTLSFIFLMISFGFLATGLDAIFSLGIFLFLGSIAGGIVSLIFGIKSITTFTSIKRARHPVPVATLVLGIVALSTAALVLLYAFVFFFALVGALSLFM